jgi:hypothetical protein
MKRSMIALALALATTGGAVAQQDDIRWTQTINVPKGQNMPRDRAEILGIELGDTYGEAKAKVQKLASEGIQTKPPLDAAARLAAKLDGQRLGPPPVSEERRLYRLQAPGGDSTITASFVHRIEFTRELPTPNGKIGETIAVQFSAPSSGHQVLGVMRSISYYEKGDQPLISETLAQLVNKMQFDPQIIGPERTKFRFQFNDGKPFAPPKPSITSCLLSYNHENAAGMQNINQQSDCDAVLEVSMTPGISSNHARNINFILSDNDRTKANLTADFAFLRDYVQKLQQETRGAPPKL